MARKQKRGRLSSLFFVLQAVLLPLLLLAPQAAYAKDAEPTVSDAVYADLALRHYLDNVSVLWHEEKNSDQITLNADRQWIPASTIKTYVALYAYYLSSKGQLDLNSTVRIDAKNVVPTELETNDFPTLTDGLYVTVDSLVRQMLTQSDNTAYNTLLDLFDRREITKYVQEQLGLADTVVGYKLNLDDSQQALENEVPGYTENTTTASDYAKVFDLIDQNKVPGSKELFDILTHQKINNMIPNLLPKDVTVAHKTGDWDPLYHDGGLIKGKNAAYTLVIFSNLGDPSIVAHISNLIYTKNFNLVGTKISATKKKTLSQVPFDDLVLHPSPNVLAAQTQPGLRAPDITAADLGITPSDLSLKVAPKQLPQVLIPYDSPFHPLVPAFFAAEKEVLGEKFGTQSDVDAISQKLAEAQDLKQRGKNDLALQVINSVEGDLKSAAGAKAVSSNENLQTNIKALSETRFDFLNTELSQASQTNRNALIKEIASEAKDAAQNVEPNLPKPQGLTPSQKPLIGEVVSSNSNSLVIKTAGGQQISVAKTSSLQTRDEQSTTATNSDFSAIKPGTNIAVVGTVNGRAVSPSFVLTNVPNDLIAPRPVTVVKVNDKQKTMVVSENGVPIQVDLTSDTKIKAKNTDIPASSIKPGDVVVVHGEKIAPQNQSGQNQPSSQNSQGQPSTPNPNVSQSPAQGTSATLTPVPGLPGAQKGQSAPAINGFPNGQPAKNAAPQNQPSKSRASVPAPQPQQIQAKSVQVIQQQSSAPQSKPQAAPPAPEKKEQKQEEKKSEEKKK